MSNIKNVGVIGKPIAERLLQAGFHTAVHVWNNMGLRWKGMLKPADANAPLPNLREDLHSALDLAQALGLE